MIVALLNSLIDLDALKLKAQRAGDVEKHQYVAIDKHVENIKKEVQGNQYPDKTKLTQAKNVLDSFKDIASISAKY